MSSGPEESKDRPAALARAALDRPVVVAVIRVQGRVASVRAEGAEVDAAFPADRLYRPDPVLLGKLRTAYERRDVRGLERLWDEAQVATAVA